MNAKTNSHLDIPADLSSKGRQAAKIIRDYLIANDMTWAECDLFMSPKKWQDRGESYGEGSVLILLHETGDAGEALSYDSACYAPRPYYHLEKLRQKLADAGFFSEQMYSWSSAVYVN